MDLIIVIAEVAALWRLGRIHYWKAFPLFYAKLLLATICYFSPRPNDDAWCRGWWATVTPALLALMLLAAIEAFRRLTERLGSPECDILAAVCINVGIFSLVSALIFLPAQGSDGFALYIWAQRAFVIGIGSAMIPPLIHDVVMPPRATVIARVHFILLAILNISIALAQASFFVFKSQAAWTAMEYGHLTVYAAMLCTWTMISPRAISASQYA